MPSVTNRVTTELDAINTLLATIGETPINSLVGALPADVAVAVNTLRETLLEVQLEGWHFNTEEDYPLVPTQDGQIHIAPSIFRVSLNDPDGRDVVQRGNRLYDRANHSYRFTEEITATVSMVLPFDDLPGAFRHYVTIRAARRFQDRTVGADSLHAYTERDEAFARTLAVHEDTTIARPSLAKGQATSFLDGWTVGATLRR